MRDVLDQGHNSDASAAHHISRATERLTIPRCVGQRPRWWCQAISFIGLLPDESQRFREAKGSRARWRIAHDQELIGGWELFPFHSNKDGLRKHIISSPWLKQCSMKSLEAAARMQPEVLFIASRVGYDLARKHVWKQYPWSDHLLGNNQFAYRPRSNERKRPEIIAISCQLGARRTFSNGQLLNAVKEARHKSALRRSDQYENCS